MANTTAATMTIREIAGILKKKSEKNDFASCHRELYADNAVSIEPQASPDFAKETKGLAGIEEKGKKWDEMVSETHSVKVSEPLIAGSSFALTMQMDITMKGKDRMQMTELCVYQVKDGKIISEQFFM